MQAGDVKSEERTGSTSIRPGIRRVPQAPNAATSATASKNAEMIMNMALVDPPRWGWTAAGNIADVLPPHERSRRRSTAQVFRKSRRKRSQATREKTKGKKLKEKGATKNLGSQSSTPLENMMKNNDCDGSIHTDALIRTKSNVLDNSSSSQPIVAFPADISVGAQDITMGKGNAPLITPTEERMDEVISATHKTTNKTLEKYKMVDVSRGSSTLPNEGRPCTGSSVGEISKDTSLTVAMDQKSSESKTEAHLQESLGLKKLSSDNLLGTTSKAALDDTLPILGIDHKYLGMEIKKVPSKPISKKNGKVKHQSQIKSTTYDCHVYGRKLDDGTLDMYSYHRGREGYEPRDPNTGELRCPLPPTDTNHNFDAPRMQLKIKINFPLMDETTEGTAPTFCETLDWDLEDPTTPSPAVYANTIGEQFGLNYGQTLELAIDIESQIVSHLQNSSNYSLPLSIEDPLCNERKAASQPSITTYRFDQVIRVAPGGTRIKTKERVRNSTREPHNNTSTSGKKRKVEGDYLDEPVDQVYVDEIKRRGHLESVHDISEKCKNGVVGLMKKQDDKYCHYCRKRCDFVLNFACGFERHSYCETHCKMKLEIFDAENPICTFCPMCSLLCKCMRCVRKADKLAAELQSEFNSQSVPLPEVRYGSVIMKACNNISVGGKKRRNSGQSAGSISTSKASLKRQRMMGETRSVLMVQKPSLLDFPREVHGSRELERGTIEDYCTVFTKNGNILTESFPEAWNIESEPRKNADEVSRVGCSGVVEDGNVDYCQVCQSHGNLLCCDYCPRAFHLECIGSEAPNSSVGTWECTECKREKQGLTEDEVVSESSPQSLSTSYSSMSIGDNGSDVLQLIWAMIEALLKYHFGYMFAEPVDLEAVDGYTAIVKTPMDLGTVKKNILSGHYKHESVEGGAAGSSESTLDGILIAILKDIELVWHNCLLFNCEGSAIHRMASVMRRRALAIQRRNFDNLLSNHVKEAVSSYVDDLTQERAEYSRLQLLERSEALDIKDIEFRSRKPKGKHKIATSFIKPKVNRPVSIFDEVNGRIVKTYASVKNAHLAAYALVSMGHPCEIIPSLDAVKQVIFKSTTDASRTLFGYRWLLLSELRAGKVSFHDTGYDGFQIYHDGAVYTFSSAEESATCPCFLWNDTHEECVKRLLTLDPDGTWTQVGKSVCRRLVRVPSSSTKKLPEVLKREAEEHVFAQCTVVKEDLITNRILVGFGSVDTAFEDWKQMVEISPLFPPAKEKSFDVFMVQYLEGNLSIDGIVWRKQKPSHVDAIPLALLSPLSSNNLHDSVIGRSEYSLLNCAPVEPKNGQKEGRSTTSREPLPAPGDSLPDKEAIKQFERGRLEAEKIKNKTIGEQLPQDEVT